MTQFVLAPSEWGVIGFIFTDQGLKSVGFPLANERAALAQIRKKHPDAKPANRKPAWLARTIKNLTGELAGKTLAAPYLETPLDLEGIPPFHQKIYRSLIKIPRGQTVSYVELAALAGSPKAARAVGQAMAKNPLPLIVPCHRVLAAGGKLGGFSAPGGLESKSRLLKAEGYESRPRTFVANFDQAAVLRELGKRDAKLRKLIQKVGPFSLKINATASPFQLLLRSIIYQQLHGKAAATIHARVCALFGGRAPEPEELLGAAEAPLRAAGLSMNKYLALKDLARAAVNGEVPTRKQAERLSDEELIARLVPIRGVGRWTVEMLLIFGLGRTDVLAVDDFALKKSAMLLYGLDDMPNKLQFQKLAEKWRPWRSIVSWYLWRALD